MRAAGVSRSSFKLVNLGRLDSKGTPTSLIHERNSWFARCPFHFRIDQYQ